MRLLAVRLARAAGDLAVARRPTAVVSAKGQAGDVVTEVDRECERLIIEGIRGSFPQHAILGEETGRHGPQGSVVQWLVDPLDGTNNYVMDVASHGVCITACLDGEPLVAVSHDAPARRTFAAVRGGGATVDDEPVRMRDPAALIRSTVSWTQGYGVDRDDATRNAAFAALERSTKRVLRTWSPSIDWGLLATGHVAGVVAYRNEPWDLVGGVLIGTEAGAGVVRDRTGDWVVVAHPAVLADLVAVLGIEPAG
ncbi:MAG: putative inositol monophosphatase [Amnibacterium sp.]|nr:putative inositol monophosphatase [Amnibacterium sp.]